MGQQVRDTLRDLLNSIREKTDLMGFLEQEEDVYVSGHVPQIAPKAYLVRHPKGLDDEGLVAAEVEATLPIPSVYQEFLREMNGGTILNVKFYGLTGGVFHRDPNDPVGQPFSIAFENEWYRRADYIPAGHFAFGSTNGPWRTQGCLFLTSTGNVEMYNSQEDEIGKVWPTFVDFLSDEISRRLEALDAKGDFEDGFQLLPGDTWDWEAIAERKYLAGLSPLEKLKRKLFG